MPRLTPEQIEPVPDKYVHRAEIFFLLYFVVAGVGCIVTYYFIAMSNSDDERTRLSAGGFLLIAFSVLYARYYAVPTRVHKWYARPLALIRTGARRTPIRYLEMATEWCYVPGVLCVIQSYFK